MSPGFDDLNPGARRKLGLLVIIFMAGCAGGGGTAWHPGVTVYDGDRAPTDEQWTGGGFVDVLVLVVRKDANGRGVSTDHTQTARDAMHNAGLGRRFEIVAEGQAHGDTLASVLWERGPLDLSPFTGWSAPALQKTAVEAGGNAVLLTDEEYSGAFRGFAGVILRCPDSPSGPACT